MPNKRNSPLWKLTKEELEKLKSESLSISDLCIKLGINPGNGSIRTLYRVAAELDVGLQFDFYRRRPNETMAQLQSLFCENSGAWPSTIRKLVRRNNLIPYICSKCDSLPVWNDQPLTLQLEHKNGNSADHRLENLTFLCPNCHSQTSSFAGRNSKRVKTKRSTMET